MEYGHLSDIKGSLVVAVSDAALEIAKSRQGLELVLTQLRKYGWRIFRRLEHFILSKSPATETGDVTDALHLKENFASRRTDPEFYGPLTQWLPKVPPGVQESVFNIFREGVDYSIYRARLKAEGKSALEIEDLLSRSKQAWQEEWMRDLTAPLPSDLASIREEVKANRQGGMAPAIMPGVRRGQPTPLSTSDVFAMSAEEFTAYISSWKPGDTFDEPVAVGTSLAARPPRRSVRALLVHTALILDENGKTLFRPGVKDAGGWEPAFSEVPHSVPVETGFLAASAKGRIPHPRALGTKGSQGMPVSWYGVVPEVTPDNRSKPGALLIDGLMHTFSERRFDFVEL